MTWVVQLIVLLGLLVPAITWADVEYTPINPQESALKVSGPIKFGDAQQFARAIQDLKVKHKNLHLNTVVLDSPGGDISQAIAIGDLVHAMRWNTYVGPLAECASACVEILIAGSERMPFGAIGIHRLRPGFDGSALPPGALKNSSDQRELMARYEQAMLGSDRLTQAATAIEPWDIRWLNDEEKKNLGLFSADPEAETEFFARITRKRGISVDELMQIMATNEHECWLDAKYLRNTFLGCVATKKMKREQAFFPIFGSITNQFLGIARSKQKRLQPINLIQREAKGELYARRMRIERMPVAISQPPAPLHVVHALERKNVWWVLNNELSVYTLNPGSTPIGTADFEISNKICGALGARSIRLRLVFKESIDGQGEFVYTGTLPFDYMALMGPGLKCGVFVGATYASKAKL